MSIAEVPDCLDVEEFMAERERAQQCLCFPLPGAPRDAFVNTLLAGNCLTQQIGYLDYAYNGFCKFPDERIQPVYQCKSIPTFKARIFAVPCNPGVGFNVACFSVRRRTLWRCAAEAEMNPSCRTTQLVPQDGSPFYDGACVFERMDAWSTAMLYEEP